MANTSWGSGNAADGWANRQLRKTLSQCIAVEVAGCGHVNARIRRILWLGDTVNLVMTTSELVRRGVSLLVLTVGAVLSARPQTSQSLSPSADQIKMEERKFYADAHPYLDEPLPKLRKMVPDLQSLKPASSQDQLAGLLAAVGTKSDELLHKVPNLISDERVDQTQWTEPRDGNPGCFRLACNNINGSLKKQSEKQQTFNFIILSHPAQGGRPMLEEYRTSRDGKPLPQGTDAPQFRGFVSTWVVFSPLNQKESSFRYLGEQKIDGHNAFVIAFAQTPGLVAYAGRILTEKESIPMLLQGIVWVDPSDFRILRLRTDILTPQPEIDLEKQSVNIRFGRARIAEIDLELWLPQEVDAEMQARGQLIQERHHYSRYRLYQAKSRIIL
jgi:hypothetical protein